MLCESWKIPSKHAGHETQNPGQHAGETVFVNPRITAKSDAQCEAVVGYNPPSTLRLRPPPHPLKIIHNGEYLILVGGGGFKIAKGNNRLRQLRLALVMPAFGLATKIQVPLKSRILGKEKLGSRTLGYCAGEWSSRDSELCYRLTSLQPSLG